MISTDKYEPEHEREELWIEVCGIIDYLSVRQTWWPESMTRRTDWPERGTILTVPEDIERRYLPHMKPRAVLAMDEAEVARLAATEAEGEALVAKEAFEAAEKALEEAEKAEEEAEEWTGDKVATAAEVFRFVDKGEEAARGLLARVGEAGPPLTPDAKLAFELDKLKVKGNAAFNAKRYDEALRHYEDALQLDPTNSTNMLHVILSNTSCVYSWHSKLPRNSKWQKSFDYAYAAVKIKQDYAKAHSRMALAFMAMRMLKEAKESLQTALHIEPSNRAPSSPLRKVDRRIAATDPRAYSSPSAFDSAPEVSVWQQTAARKSRGFVVVVATDDQHIHAARVRGARLARGAEAPAEPGSRSQRARGWLVCWGTRLRDCGRSPDANTPRYGT